MNTKAMTARLVLENGSVFRGQAFGASGPDATTTGEVVFNTAMCGYQEALTDPSYSGQILVMTAPMIGNYGVASDDLESDHPQVAGFVIRELSRRHSNYRAIDDLSNWLRSFGTPAITGIDTRALVRQIREQGALRGVISTDESLSDGELLAMARQAPSMAGCDLATGVTVDSTTSWNESLGEWADFGTEAARSPEGSYRVVALDCGAKRNIYRHLTELGCTVIPVPITSSPDEIRALNPDGLFISNGPGDPAAVTTVISTLQAVAGEWPTFGICLGHQLLSLALGATTYKLKFGHRGANQPVRNTITGCVEITSQNHGFCVDPDSLDAIDCEVTHLHLNDGTVAGLRHRSKPIFSVQHHPEASPGPHDASYLFDCFLTMLRTRQPLTAEEMTELQKRRQLCQTT